MKIALATSKDNLSSSISSQAGRAPYYLIVNDQGQLLETIKNPFAIGGGGAGNAAAKMLADKGVNLVIAEKFGPNMTAALEEQGVRYKEKQGLIEDVIKETLSST
jgi:predicted Fe-Mo cluster-binding NifX family protein